MKMMNLFSIIQQLALRIRVRRGLLLRIAVIGFLVVSLVAQAQYNVSYIDLTPPGALGGDASFTSGTVQAGNVSTSNGNLAGLWSGPSHQFMNLHPPNVDWSWVSAVAGNQQAGATYSVAAWGHNAAIWNGTVTSYRNLNPPGSSDSMVLGTTGNQQAGYVTIGFNVHAALWSGSAGSFIDLNPAAEANSIAHAIAGNQQAGTAYLPGGTHAAIWSGTAASFRDLNPAGAQTSEIFATTGTQQAGVAASAGRAHAGIWSGTADSFVDLHPAGAQDSQALATIGTHQAGFAYFPDSSLGGAKHAVLWFGSASNYIDLDLALGQAFRDSQARSIWTDGTTILVAGVADARPILWTVTMVPEPGAGSLFAAALVIWIFARGRALIKSQTAAPLGALNCVGCSKPQRSP